MRRVSHFVPAGLSALGTDGFGRSDTREALRRFFEVDAESICVAALHQLARRGQLGADQVQSAISDLGLDPVAAKALFILGRVAGLSAHYFEEIRTQPPMRRVNFAQAEYRGPEDRGL